MIIKYYALQREGGGEVSPFLPLTCLCPLGALLAHCNRPRSPVFQWPQIMLKRKKEERKEIMCNLVYFAMDIKIIISISVQSPTYRMCTGTCRRTLAN